MQKPNAPLGLPSLTLLHWAWWHTVRCSKYRTSPTGDSQLQSLLCTFHSNSNLWQSQAIHSGTKTL